ncbi:TlpA family protein disulfide reductase, partial [[Kitasatospora] papulosa]
PLNPKPRPSTVVVDREGKLAARSLAALDATKLREMIDPLVAEK